MKPKIAVLGLTVLSLARTSAAVAYTENFYHTSGSHVASNTQGWNAYHSGSATDLSSTAPGTGNRLGIATNDGPAGPTPAELRGYLFSVSLTSSTVPYPTQIFAATTSLATPVAVDSITWDMGNTSSALTARILIQQGGNWYASAATYTTAAMTSAADFATNAEGESLAFSTLASNWLSLTLNPGTELTLGGTPASNLSSNVITGFGYFFTHVSTNSTARVDNITINGTLVPEPSISMVLGLGLLGTALRRKR